MRVLGNCTQSGRIRLWSAKRGLEILIRDRSPVRKISTPGMPIRIELKSISGRGVVPSIVVRTQRIEEHGGRLMDRKQELAGINACNRVSKKRPFLRDGHKFLSGFPICAGSLPRSAIDRNLSDFVIEDHISRQRYRLRLIGDNSSLIVSAYPAVGNRERPHVRLKQYPVYHVMCQVGLIECDIRIVGVEPDSTSLIAHGFVVPEGTSVHEQELGSARLPS